MEIHLQDVRIYHFICRVILIRTYFLDDCRRDGWNARRRPLVIQLSIELRKGNLRGTKRGSKAPTGTFCYQDEWDYERRNILATHVVIIYQRVSWDHCGGIVTPSPICLPLAMRRVTPGLFFRDLMMVKMKSMFAIGFVFTSLLSMFNSIFDGKVVAHLPFTPISWVQGISHRYQMQARPL